MPRLAAGITLSWSAVVVAASTRDAESVGVAVVVCMRDSYSDPAAASRRRLVWRSPTPPCRRLVWRSHTLSHNEERVWSA